MKRTCCRLKAFETALLQSNSGQQGPTGIWRRRSTWCSSSVILIFEKTPFLNSLRKENCFKTWHHCCGILLVLLPHCCRYPLHGCYVLVLLATSFILGFLKHFLNLFSLIL